MVDGGGYSTEIVIFGLADGDSLSGSIYFFDQSGKTLVLEPGRTLKILATNTLANGFMASPAIAGKAFFLRSKTHLYRIES